MTSGKRMRGADVEVAALLSQGTDIQRRVIGQVAHIGDEELDILGAQAFQQLLPVALLHAQGNLRMQSAQFGQHQRQEGRGREGPDAECRVAQLTVAIEIDIALQAACLEQQPPRPRDHEFAGRGWPHVSDVAIEQADAKVAFNGLDAATEGWLAKVNTLRRPREMQLIGKRQDMTEAAEVHHFNALNALEHCECMHWTH
ncbi:protein of unknown function [Cupriavidus taiwanensis]|nr:protein of unknown function [Cupriavidus taiwanensis]